MERYLAAGYGIEVEWSKALGKDPHGSISKMALIVKAKQDCTVNRRIIVDLRRSVRTASRSAPSASSCRGSRTRFRTCAS